MEENIIISIQISSIWSIIVISSSVFLGNALKIKENCYVDRKTLIQSLGSPSKRSIFFLFYRFVLITLKRRGMPWYTLYMSPISFAIAFIITIFHCLLLFGFYSFTDISLLYWYFSYLKQPFLTLFYSKVKCIVIPASLLSLFSSPYLLCQARTAHSPF